MTLTQELQREMDIADSYRRMEFLMSEAQSKLNMSELYSTSEMHGWSKQELIDEIEASRDLIEILKQRCITGFYGDEVPQYNQGIPVHELEDYATAEEINKQVEIIQGVREVIKPFVDADPNLDKYNLAGKVEQIIKGKK